MELYACGANQFKQLVDGVMIDGLPTRQSTLPTLTLVNAYERPPEDLSAFRVLFAGSSQTVGMLREIR